MSASPSTVTVGMTRLEFGRRNEERLGLSPSGEPRLASRICLVVANLREATEFIVRKHYLRRGRTMAQLPYWVTLDGDRAGVILYSYPRLSVEFHGHAPLRLLELARLWVDPNLQGLRVMDRLGREHSLAVASCAVGRSLRRIRGDWYGKYPHLPDVDAVVAWSDQVHHEGTIYRAANFRETGTSGGALHRATPRPNGGHDHLHADYVHVKTTFLYEFRRSLTKCERRRAEREWASPSAKGLRASPRPPARMQGGVSLASSRIGMR